MISTVDNITVLPEGQPGAVLLISGRWNANKEYTRDSEVIPLVEHDGLFYSLNKIGAIVGGLNPKDDYARYGSKATWKLQNSYEMIIVKAVVADGGLLGDFVFWGGKMFSKQGVDRQSNFSDKYTEYPKGNFIPNYTVDAVTGEIIAMKGKFGLLEIVGNTLVGKSLSGDELIRITGDQVPLEEKFTPNYVIIPEYEGEKINEKFLFSMEQNNSNIVPFRKVVSFDLNLPEIGEYRFDECLCVPESIKDAYTHREMLDLFMINYSLDFEVYRGGELIFQKHYTYADRQDGVSPEFFSDFTGEHHFEFNFLTVFQIRGEADYVADMITSIRGLEHKPAPRQCTFVGSDGLYSSFSTTEYLHYKAGQGITIKSGNYGLRVSQKGIQKWNGSKWIAANI